MLVRNYVTYTTDLEKDIGLVIRYEEDTNDERLVAGGFTSQYLQTGGCRIVLPRKRIKPRYCLTADKGQIYFRTHALWLKYAEDNKKNIIKMCGECLSCMALHFII